MENLISGAGEFLAGGTAASVYWCLAVFGTFFFALTCILAIFGVGGLDGADFGADGLALDHLDTGYLDFNLFSIRSILAFLTVFGWGGVIWGHHGIWGFVGAFLAGLATMAATALVIWGMMKLQSSGTISNRAYVGQHGIVYLGIPGGRTEAGKIVVTLNAATHELKAVADEAIPTGAAVLVVDQLDNRHFLVKKI